MMHILFEKTTARNGSHPDMLSEPLAEMQVIPYTILRDIKHHIIGSFGISKLQSELTKSVTEQTLHVSIMCLQPLVIGIREAQSDGCRLHQWSCCTDSKEVMHLLYPVYDAFRGNDIAKSPACDAVGLGERATRNSALPWRESYKKQCAPTCLEVWRYRRACEAHRRCAHRLHR